MLNILKQIHLEQDRIDAELEVKDPKLEFYQHFFSTFTHRVVKSYYEIDKCDLVIATLAAHDSSLPIETLQDIIYSNREIIEDMDLEQYGTIIETFINLYKLGNIEKVKKYLESNCQPTEEEAKEDTALETTRILFDLAKIYNTKPSDFAKLFTIFEEEIITDDDTKRPWNFPLMSVISIIKLLSETKETYLEFTSKLNDRQFKKVMSPKFKQSSKEHLASFRKEFDDHMDLIKRYHDSLISSARSKRRSLQVEKQIYDDVEKEIYQMIRNPHQEVSHKKAAKIASESIRLSLLTKMYEHNMSIYQESEQEYQKLAANDAANYRILLANHGLAPSNYEVGSIMGNSISDVEQIINYLQTLGIKSPSALLSILQITNLETIKNFVAMQQKGIITPTLILENINVLDPNSKEYENSMRNLALIQEKKMNPRYFTAYAESLLAEHQTFKLNLDILERYNLTSFLKTGINSSFIATPDLQSSIDTLIELGFEKQLEEKIELLNYKNNFKRLRLLKQLNVPVTSIEELEEVLTTDKFFVSDSAIDEYLYNAVLYKLPKPISDQPSKRSLDLSRLDQYQTSERTYTIGGVIISKPKVKTNIASSKQFRKPGERLLYGILAGSVLSDEEVESIKRTLSPKKTYTKK